MRGEMPLQSPDKAAPPRESSIVNQIIGNQTYVRCIHMKIGALPFTFLAAHAQADYLIVQVEIVKINFSDIILDLDAN